MESFEAKTATRIDPFEVYLQDVSRFPRISAQREKELSLRVQKFNDKKARDQLVQANLQLGISFAKKYCGRGIDFQDIIQLASEGLLEAADNFDYTRNTRFSTYAECKMRKHFKMGIVKTRNTVSIPRYIYELVIKYKKIEEAMNKKNTEKVSFDEVIQTMELTENTKEYLQKGLMFYDAKNISELQDDNNFEIAAIIDDQEEKVINQDVKSERLKLINKALTKIGGKKCKWMKMEHGLNKMYKEGFTRSALAKKIGKSASRIGQINCEVIETLKAAVANN